MSNRTQLVWYYIELDKIFISDYVDAMFFGLHNLDWHKIEILGEL